MIKVSPEKESDKRAALAEEYIAMTFDKYKAAFTDIYNRSPDPDLLLERERKAYKRAAFDEDAGALKGLVTYRRAGGSWSPALGAKYGNVNPYGWANDIAGLIDQYVARPGDIAAAVTFTKIVPGETSFKPGDAVAIYRYFKWLEAGEIAPEKKAQADEGLVDLLQGISIDELTERLQSKNYVSDAGEWIGKGNQIPVLWDTMRAKALIRPNTPVLGFGQAVRTHYKGGRGTSDSTLKTRPGYGNEHQEKAKSDFMEIL